MEQSTQWGVSLPNTFPMKKQLKSRNPAPNIPRRHEAVATDTVFSDTPAVDSGGKQAQVFTFYQPVFYATYDQHFPSVSEERAGYWVGFGEHCGDAMTHKILDHDTQRIIYRSAVRPKKSSTSTIGLHHMEGRFLHLLTLLKIKFPLDHHLDPQKVPHRNRRPLQSLSGPEMKRIHLDPSLCLPLTPVT